MNRNQSIGKKPGEKLKVLMGPYKDQIVEIVSIDFVGAYNGWFTVKTLAGTSLLFAGEEVEEVE